MSLHAFQKWSSLTLLYPLLLAPLLNGSAVTGVCMDLQLVHNTKGGNITSHQSRIRHYFLLLPLPKSCLSPRYV